MSNNQMVRIPIVGTGARQRVPIPCGLDYVQLSNITVSQTNNAAVTLLAVESKFYGDMAQGTAICYKKKTGTNDIENPPCATGGFTVIDDANPGSNPAIALSNPTFTQADPAVWGTATNSFVAGDIVRVYNITGAMQYASLDLSVTAADSTHFTSLLDTTAITQGTAGFVRKLNLDTSLYYPRRRYIAKVTTGSTTLVRLTVEHGYKLNEYVRFLVPTIFGMKQLNGLRGKIIALDDTLSVNTITVDIDSSSFDAFAYPATTDVPFSFAIVVPDSEFPAFIDAATRNVGIKGVELGSVICGNAEDVMELIAFQADQVL